MTRTTKTTTRKPTPNANKVNVNANKVKVNANKVGINAAKVRANAAKVAANAASVKANAAKAKVTPKVSATKVAADNKVKMSTFVPTAKSTKGKSYLISTKQGDRFGTAAQLDSATLAKNLYNQLSPSGRTATRNIAPNANASTTRGYLTKESEKGKASYSNKLPSYVAPKDTKSGALLLRSEVPGATGKGGCRPGYRLDAGGNCVKK